MTGAGTVFVTATSSMSPGSRQAASAASAISWRTSESRSETEAELAGPRSMTASNRLAGARNLTALANLVHSACADEKTSEDHGGGTLRRAKTGEALAGGLGEAGHFPRLRERPAPEILCSGNVPLPVGAHPHGPRAELHHGRRRRPLHARQGP